MVTVPWDGSVIFARVSKVNFFLYAKVLCNSKDVNFDVCAITIVGGSFLLLEVGLSQDHCNTSGRPQRWEYKITRNNAAVHVV